MFGLHGWTHGVAIFRLEILLPRGAHDTFSLGSSTVLATKKEASTTGDMERKSQMTNDAKKSGESWGQAVYMVLWNLERIVFDFACSNADSEDNHL